jgi:cytochrome P450
MFTCDCGDEAVRNDTAQRMTQMRVLQARRFNPFGQGVRNCLGQQLARTNVPTAVAMFIAHLKLQLTPEVSVLQRNCCAPVCGQRLCRSLHKRLLSVVCNRTCE